MDSDQSSRQPSRTDHGPETQRGPRRFWLEFQGRSFELRPGEVLIGRSSGCHLVLDDGLVSRRHAQIVVRDDHALVEDFGSANGVFVNGRRVQASEPLKGGDELAIGKQVFVVRSVSSAPVPKRVERANAETLNGVQVTPEMRAASAKALAASEARDGTKPDLRVPTESEATHRAEALELLGGVADKVLALGRGEEAERVLATTLNNVLAQAKRGKEPPPRVLGRAAMYAGKLAEATAHGKWLDYTVELFAELKRPLPIEFVDQMYAVLRRVDGVNVPALRAYLAMLHAQPTAYGPNERFAIQRLEGFERLAALK